MYPMKKISIFLLAIAAMTSSCHKENTNPLVSPGHATNYIFFENQGNNSFEMYIGGYSQGVIGGASTRMFTVNTGTWQCEVRQVGGGTDELFTAIVSDWQACEIDFQ